MFQCNTTAATRNRLQRIDRIAPYALHYSPCQHPIIARFPLLIHHITHRPHTHTALAPYATTPSPVGSGMGGLIRLELLFSPFIGLPVSGLPSPILNLGGGVLTRLCSAGRLRTTREWMAQDTQYSIFMYSFGTTYTSYTDASFKSLCAAVSIMLRTTMRLMALSCVSTARETQGDSERRVNDEVSEE